MALTILSMENNPSSANRDFIYLPPGNELIHSDKRSIIDRVVQILTIPNLNFAALLFVEPEKKVKTNGCDLHE